MTLYLDTSLLVAALTNEPKTERSHQWLDEQDQSDLFMSDWVVTEFSAAIAKKVRIGTISPEEQALILASFRLLADTSLAFLACDRAIFQKASELADRHDLGLRAGDALHLAISIEHNATLCTLDQRLAAAGTEVATNIIYF